MRVLAIGAHPDDLEIFCGGTLAKYAREGAVVIMACLLQGDKSFLGLFSQDIVEVREREAKDAAQLIGARHICLGFRDAELFSTLESRSRVVDLIRVAAPDLILTHAPIDYHSDHRAVANIVCDSAYISTSPGFKTEHNPLQSIPPVYFMDTLMGINFQPTEYVDITETIETKKKMIQMHKSQFEVLRKRGGVDLIQSSLDIAKFRGWQCGVKYAEGFQPFLAWPNFRPRRLLP